MKQNVVFFTCMNQAPDVMDYQIWCLKSWKHWCDKHNVLIFILEEPLVPIEQMKPTWQRWHVLEILEANNIEYDQVALVDMDTLIHPDAPNFFNLLPGKGIGAVQDDLMVEWVYNSIKGYQDFWPGIHFDWTTYFNCGFIVINESHKELCKKITDFYYANREELQRRQHETLRKGSDQTPVNYMVRDWGKDLDVYPIEFLDKQWNFTHMHQRGVLNDLMPYVGYVFHFNGFEKTQRAELMRASWNHLKKVCNI